MSYLHGLGLKDSQSMQEGLSVCDCRGQCPLEYIEFIAYPDYSPPGQFPHPTGIGPHEWIYWLVVVLVGSCPRDSGPGGE